MTDFDQSPSAKRERCGYLRHALRLAIRGEGFVEPNPMVGCVIVRDDQVIGSGWHEAFGGPHAEINALNSIETGSAENATVYVTLEPCPHTGKTGPCVDALIAAKVAKVVVGCKDPNPLVAGQGISKLRQAGIAVKVGTLAKKTRGLIAPFQKRIQLKKPWIIAKWAMTLDGKIATSTGDSQWISNDKSRTIVHEVRQRVDGIMVGIGTAIADDPMLNARPSGARVATRIVVDSKARLSVDSKLAKTAREFPTLISVGPKGDAKNCEQLKSMGCEIFQSNNADANERLQELLGYLSESGMTNVLVEGGGELLGSLNDIHQIDEYHVFIGAKVLGGSESLGAIGGMGHNLMNEANNLDIQKVRRIGSDTYIVARNARDSDSN